MLEFDALARRASLEHVQVGVLALDLLVKIDAHFVELGTKIDAWDVKRVFELLGGRHNRICRSGVAQGHAKVAEGVGGHEGAVRCESHRGPERALRQRLLAEQCARARHLHLQVRQLPSVVSYFNLRDFRTIAAGFGPKLAFIGSFRYLTTAAHAISYSCCPCCFIFM